MLNHMENIAKKVRDIEQQRYLWVFDKLEILLNRFKDEKIHTEKVSDKASACSAYQFTNSVAEVDEFEPPCKKFKKRIGMVNSLDRMLKHLEETGTLKAEFYNFTSDESDGDSEDDDDDELVNDEHCLSQSSEKSVDTRAKFRKTMFKKITALKQRFEHYCSCTPVLGFNSSKYDLNLVKTKLCKHLALADPDVKSFTVKRNNSYLTIATPTLKFLDISHYIAPGYSYAQFLKSYKAKEEKGFFCYEYLSDPSILEETELPPYESFYSNLKRCNVLEQEMLLWREKYGVKLQFQVLECPLSVKQLGMKTIRDFLIYYNLKDIDPFTEAVTNMQTFFIENNVDIFKDSISVPGVARQMLFKSEKAKFALFDSKNEDLYYTIKQGICGGPSIVYTRSMERGQKLKGGDEICKNIFGFDANALYPYCLSQEMPCGTFVRRRESNLYKPEIQTKYLDMFVWMDKISEMNNIRIMHRLNSGKEHYIMGYYVDGICGMNVFSYLGCYHHSCQ